MLKKLMKIWWTQCNSVYCREWFAIVHTCVVLGESIRVNDIKPSEIQELIALDDILPFAFDDSHTWLVSPAQVFHMP
jgi:hypothetical protein